MVRGDSFVHVASRQTEGFRWMNTSVSVYFVLLQDIVGDIKSVRQNLSRTFYSCRWINKAADLRLSLRFE